MKKYVPSNEAIKYATSINKLTKAVMKAFDDATAIAKKQYYHKFPTLEQLKSVIVIIDRDIERNREEMRYAEDPKVYEFIKIDINRQDMLKYNVESIIKYLYKEEK